MKVCVVFLGLFAACALAYTQQLNNGPVLVALQQPQYEQQQLQPVAMIGQPRQKRSLLLGAGLLGAGALGAGILGAGALGAGALGAGALGAGIIGAKAGFVGGALASRAFSGRSYGGFGGGFGGGYGAHYYYDSEPIVYGGYRSYPSYYVDDEWC